MDLLLTYLSSPENVSLTTCNYFLFTGTPEQVRDEFRRVRDEIRRVFEAYASGLKEAAARAK